LYIIQQLCVQVVFNKMRDVPVLHFHYHLASALFPTSLTAALMHVNAAIAELATQTTCEGCIQVHRKNVSPVCGLVFFFLGVRRPRSAGRIIDLCNWQYIGIPFFLRGAHISFHTYVCEIGSMSSFNPCLGTCLGNLQCNSSVHGKECRGPRPFTDDVRFGRLSGTWMHGIRPCGRRPFFFSLFTLVPRRRF